MDLWRFQRTGGKVETIHADRVEEGPLCLKFYRLPAPAATWAQVTDEKPKPKLVLMVRDWIMVWRVRDPKKPEDGGLHET